MINKQLNNDEYIVLNTDYVPSAPHDTASMDESEFICGVYIFIMLVAVVAHRQKMIACQTSGTDCWIPPTCYLGNKLGYSTLNE